MDKTNLEKVFVNHGYKKYSSSFSSMIFQKDIRDEHGKILYFITAFVYLFSGVRIDFQIRLLLLNGASLEIILNHFNKELNIMIENSETFFENITKNISYVVYD